MYLDYGNLATQYPVLRTLQSHSAHALHNLTLINVTLATLSFVFCYCTYNYFFHPLAGIPGPLSAKLGVDSWIMMRACKRDAAWRLREQHDKHGLTVRIARNQVSIGDPEAINTVFKTGFDKSSFYYWFKMENRVTIMAEMSHHKHLEMKRGMAPAFANSTMTALEEFIDIYSGEFGVVLDEHARDKQPIEMAKWFQFYALDVVGDVAFGQSFDMLRSHQDPLNLLMNLEVFNTIVALLGQGGWLGPILDWTARKLTGGEGAKQLSEFNQKCVGQRMLGVGKDSSSRNDMLGKLIKAKHSDGRPYSKQDVEDVSSMIVGAGSDTTAITFRCFLYYLFKDPRVAQKLQREIDDAVDQGKMTIPVSYAQAVKLDYFQACLKEVLRVHPAVDWLLPRYVPKGGAEVAGRFYKGGVEVSMSPAVVHWRPEAYGPDAKEFRPERWLEANEEERKIMERNLLSFGTGSRICQGRHLSILELSKLIPQILYKYTFTPTPRGPGSPHKCAGTDLYGRKDDREPWNVSSQWFNIQRDFWFDVRTRDI